MIIFKTFRPNRFELLLCLSILVFSCAPNGLGQGVGANRGLPSTTGNNIIKGRVLFPFEPKEGKRVKVRLTSTDFFDQSTVTDGDGVFTFNGLPPGHYTIFVDAGKDFDTATESLSIDREASAGGRNQMVAINLKAKGSADAFAKIPKDARDAYAKGIDAVSKGETKTAVEMFEKAVTIYPTFSQALGELGLLYMRSGKMDKAVKTYESLLAANPNDATAHLNYGIALYNVATAQINDKKLDEAKENLTKAELELRQSLKTNSASPSGHYYLGLIMIKSKRYPEAQQEMESAIANGGQDLALAHKYLGGLYMSSNRPKDAADQLEKYLELDPKTPEAEKIRGTIKELRSKQ